MRSTKFHTDVDRSRFGAFLEDLYVRYNKKELIHPDPLEFLAGYPSIEDREIVGLVASSLAYGRVAQILKSVSGVLTKMGSSPFDFVTSGNPDEWGKIFSGFRHRFSGSEDLIELLSGIRRTIEIHGSLDDAMADYSRSSESTFNAYEKFVDGMIGRDGKNTLLPYPGRGSACKRLMLYFRWMVRRDDVDPGGWKSLSPSDLIVPLDTHMHRIALSFGFTSRKNGDFRTAVEVTEVFRLIDPEDPVKYDFALTRFGIRDDLDVESLLEKAGPKVGGLIG